MTAVSQIGEARRTLTPAVGDTTQVCYETTDLARSILGLPEIVTQIDQVLAS